MKLLPPPRPLIAWRVMKALLGLFLWLGIASLGLIAAMFAVGAVVHSVNGTAVASPIHIVTYVVDNQDGSAEGGRASITIENGTGGTEQDDVTLPWKKEFTPEPGQFLYVSAQNIASYRGIGIKASILVDGVTLRHAESGAEYGIASVSARY